MRSFPAMVDLKRSDADKAEDAIKGLCMPKSSEPDYDYGLNLTFNEETIEKLNLDDDVSVGDFLHIHAFARVTGVHEDERDGKCNRRIELVLTHVASEDEESEGEDD